jgi:hypothetical protein
MMIINYYQLETLAHLQHEERLANAAKQRLIQLPQRKTLPLATWVRRLSEQKDKWVAPRQPATIEPAC